MKTARTDEVLDWRTRLRDTVTGPEATGAVKVNRFDRMFMQFQLEHNSQAAPGEPIPEDLEPEEPPKI